MRYLNERTYITIDSVTRKDVRHVSSQMQEQALYLVSWF